MYFSSVKLNNCAIVLEIHNRILGAPVGICSNGQWEVGSVFFLFFFGNFFLQSFNLRKMNSTHIKDFCERNMLNSPNFIFFPLITRFLQWVPENNQNVKGFKKNINFLSSL